MTVRTFLAHSLGCLDEIDTVSIVLWHSCGNGKDVQIEDDISWREADLFGEQLISTLSN